jgi:hypothetical protein
MTDEDRADALLIDMALFHLHLTGLCQCAEGGDTKFASLYFGALTAVGALMRTYLSGEVGTASKKFDQTVSVLGMGYELSCSGMPDEDVFDIMDRLSKEVNNG